MAIVHCFVSHYQRVEYRVPEHVTWMLISSNRGIFVGCNAWGVSTTHSRHDVCVQAMCDKSEYIGMYRCSVHINDSTGSMCINIYRTMYTYHQYRITVKYYTCCPRHAPICRFFLPVACFLRSSLKRTWEPSFLRVIWWGKTMGKDQVSLQEKEKREGLARGCWKSGSRVWLIWKAWTAAAIRAMSTLD